MKKFTINDLENLTGVKKHTIRIWERRYNLLTPERSNTNIRFYSIYELENLLNISLLSRQGFKISKLAIMPAPEINKLITGLKSAEASHDRAVKDLLLAMLQLDTENFEFLLDSCCATFGTDQNIVNVIIPLLERARLFWQPPADNKLQSHFVNLIRGKLHKGIEKAQPADRKQKFCLLFLPKGEHYELPLLYSYYLLAKAGFKIVYMGADNAVEDVEFMARIKNPAYMVTCNGYKSHRFSMERLTAYLDQHLPDTTLIILDEQTSLSDHLKATA